MNPTPSRLGRVALRTIVLVQLAALSLVAFTVHEFVTSGSEVIPGAVALVATMLACTVVALRATFRRTAGTRGHRFVFMAAQAINALAPLVGRTSLVSFIGSDGGLTPDEVVGPGLVVGMLGLELLFAAVLAGVSALLAPLLLAPPPDSTATSPFSRALGVWAVAAALVAVLVSTLYGAHFEEARNPQTRLKQLLESKDEETQWNAAQHLAATDLSAHPEVRSALFDALEAPGSIEQAWAAYVLIAAGADDGRAMKQLRKMAGTFAVGRAVQSLALLGAAAAPALGELTRLVRLRTEDNLVAAVQRVAAGALAAIGPPALGAVPFLVERAQEQDYLELRLTAASAIDQIDPDFARRCATAGATMVDALAATGPAALAIRPECLPPKQSPPSP